MCPNSIKKSWQIKWFVVFGYKLTIHGFRQFSIGVYREPLTAVCGSTFKQFDLDWRWIKEVDSGLFFHLEIEEKSTSGNLH